MINKQNLIDEIVREINYKLENSFDDTVTIDIRKLGFSSEELSLLGEFLETLENYNVIVTKTLDFDNHAIMVIADRELVTNWLQPKKNGTPFPSAFASPIITYQDLTINKLRSALYFKDQNKPININLTNKPIKFLTLLLEQPETLVSYSDIYHKCLHERLSLDDINSDPTVKATIKGLKKDLGKYLESRGLSKELVKLLKLYIQSKTNQGYLLKSHI